MDESGDGVLFNAKGQVLAGRPDGSMGYFMLGLLEVDEPAALSSELAQLRTELAADPYFNLNPAVTPPPSSPQAVLAARSSGQCDHRYTATDKPNDPPA